MFLIPFLLSVQEIQGQSIGKEMQQISKSLQSELNLLKQSEDRKDKIAMAHSLGNLGNIYLQIVKQPLDSFKQYDFISTDKKVNLDKSIDYSSKSIKLSQEIGNIEQMKKSYKNLRIAQMLAGNVKGALDSYRKMGSLKHNSKKANEIERKQLAYNYEIREDSILIRNQVTENHLKDQTRKLTQKESELQISNKALLVTEKEKDLQTLNMELQQNKLQLQQTKLLLQQNELEKKDRNIELRGKERNYYLLGLLALLVFSLLTYRNIRVQKRYNKALVKEKKISEDLILNILPAVVVEELKVKGFADAKQFHNVTVLFTDFVSFTSVTGTMSPHQLVGELHICFKAFDEIIGKYRIEKIKTIGDAYMAASGLPVSNPNHAIDLIGAAIEIRDFMQLRKELVGSKTFGVRIGLNSGNVVAGIVGIRKFSYDIWGDTVNTASRMEQNSESGKINISHSTYELVKDKIACAYRGEINTKGKGHLKMYYVT